MDVVRGQCGELVREPPAVYRASATKPIVANDDNYALAA